MEKLILRHFPHEDNEHVPRGLLQPELASSMISYGLHIVTTTTTSCVNVQSLRVQIGFYAFLLRFFENFYYRSCTRPSETFYSIYRIQQMTPFDPSSIFYQTPETQVDVCFFKLQSWTTIEFVWFDSLRKFLRPQVPLLPLLPLSIPDLSQPPREPVLSGNVEATALYIDGIKKRHKAAAAAAWSTCKSARRTSGDTKKRRRRRRGRVRTRTARQCRRVPSHVPWCCGRAIMMYQWRGVMADVRDLPRHGSSYSTQHHWHRTGATTKSPRNGTKHTL